MFDQQQSSEFTMYFYTCSLIQSLKQSYKAGTTTVLLHRLRNKPKKVKLQLVSGGSISKPMSSDFQSRAFLATWNSSQVALHWAPDTAWACKTTAGGKGGR